MAKPTRKSIRTTVASNEAVGDIELPGKLTSRKASEARRQFFALLERVALHDPTEIIVIEHKDLPQPAALVNAPFLFRVLRLLRSLTARQRGSATPFRLIGSATLVGEPTDVLTGARERQHALEQAKRATL